MFPHGETVTRLRGTPVVDPYSDEATDTDWSEPSSLDIPGCAVAAGPTDDTRATDRDATVVSDFTVYAPAGSDITAPDRLVLRGLTCEVVGRPFEWRSPFTGWQPGMAVNCNVVEG